MWRWLKRVFSSLKTYRALSPDLQLRQQINRGLNDRPALSLAEWSAALCQARSLDAAIVQFAYAHLGDYCGLEISRLLPSDRLEADLGWSQVCWFDWETQLSQDLSRAFGIDLGDLGDLGLESNQPEMDWETATVADLVKALEQVCFTAKVSEL